MLPPATFQPRVRLLTEHYLQRKCENLRASVDHSTQIKRLIFELQKVLQDSDQPGRPAMDLLAQLQHAGIMRFFICDADGYQVSPNYEVIAATRKRTGFDLVASTIYRDVNTAQLCKTFGLYLDDNRILLVDAAVRDEVLYVGSQV